MATEQVLVRNLNSEPYTELFKFKTITIPANGTIKMARSEANNFLGQFSGIDNNTGEIRVKRLRIEPLSNATLKEEPKFVSNLNGQVFDTKEALDAHLEANKDKIIEDKEPEKAPSCPFCHVQVKDKLALQVHLKNCTKG